MATPVFQTDDGYVLYFVSGQWVDNLDPELVDLTFDGDARGPVEASGERIGGERTDNHHGRANPSKGAYEPGQVRMASGKSWKPRFLAKATASPEVAQDQDYWEVFHRWRKLLEDWGVKHRVLFEWKHSKQLGETRLEVIPAAGVTAAALKRIVPDIEEAFYGLSQQAVNEALAASKASQSAPKKASRERKPKPKPRPRKATKRSSGGSMPTAAQAKKEAEQRATLLTGRKPDRVTVDMPDEDALYPIVSVLASYKLGSVGGAHIKFAWTGTTGWELRTMGFGYDKLPKMAADRLKPILDDADALHEPFRVGKSWTISMSTSGLKQAPFIDDVWVPSMAALHKARKR
jgi:hypothetical protein